MFTELPSCVLAALLFSWLDIEDVARLDSACCRRSTREMFLHLCQRKEIAFEHELNLHNTWLMMWIIVRRMHVTSIQIGSDAAVSFLPRTLFVTGEQLYSVVVSFLEQSTAMVAVFCLLALYCPNLAILTVYRCTVDIALFELLAAGNSFLNNITKEACSVKTVNLLDKNRPPLQSVQTLVVHMPPTVLEVINLEPFLIMFPSLLKLELHCTHLTDESVVQIVNYCPQIRACFLYRCSSLTEQSLNVAIERWRLHELAVRDSGSYSDELLQCVSKNSATLRSFLFRSANSFTSSGIVNLLRSCPRLTTLTLGWYPTTPQEFVERVAPTLSNIIILVLEQALCCDEALFAVGKYCVQLEILDLYDDEIGVINHTGGGLLRVIKECSCLHTLVVSSSVKKAIFSIPLLQTLLHSIAPHLQISCAYNIYATL